MHHVVRSYRRVRGRQLRQSKKPAHDFPITFNTKFYSVCRRLAAIPMPNYGPQFDPPVRGLGWTLGVEMVGLPIEMSSPHSVSTCIHTICISCIVWSQYTTRQTTDRRPADRAIGSSRLCYSVGGLKIHLIILFELSCYIFATLF